MSVDQAVRTAARRLAEAGVETPARDARRLMAHALRIDTDRLALASHDTLSPAAAVRFDAAVAARESRQPVAQIIGWRDFYGRRFRVTPDVLDPRPDTETLIDAALGASFDRVLDLGTGSGCILLTLLAERPGATGIGTDISPAALAVARTNAAHLNLSDRSALCSSDWFSNITNRFDLIVANPPYIAADEMAALSADVRDHEPHIALTPGGDGLAAYRAIAAGARAHLATNGRLLVEIGHTQAAPVSAILTQAGLRVAPVILDMNGQARVLSAVV